MLSKLLKTTLLLLIVRPLILIVIGLNVRHRNRLPFEGPAMIVANHNSHIDTFVLLSLFPLRMVHIVRPVAAADYFLRNRFISWFSRKVIGIIPVARTATPSAGDPLSGCSEALERGEIILIYPEGSRGEPGRITEFKSGVAHLAERHPDVPVHPIFLHGTGKVLPKGEGALVPFFCDVFVGEQINWGGERKAFLEELRRELDDLAAEGKFPPWE
ncbi:MAG TPA: 1-acyl-sn-glycerol-3-phosphate acyltransferase [Planctomycetes bacterium]|nr:1-acyl-sn-glycerol-3-phosphate acyltransferase [Planctomycetota bacterium]HIN79465.1 1-acyl-sn-glycerol-3-phosphate acyltransferase [Planctomycetota bacterium]